MSAIPVPDRPRAILRGRTIGLELLERLGLPLMLVGVVVVFGVLEPTTFFTTANLQSVLSSQSVLAVLAIAAVVPFVSGQFDLSLPAILGLTQMVAAALMAYRGTPLGVTIAICLAIGAGVGLANGLAVARLGVNSIITTLGTASVIQAFTLLTTNGETIATGLSSSLTTFGAQTWLGIPSTAYCVLVAGVVVAYILGQTPLGRSLEAFGTNPRAARLIGLSETRLVLAAFVIGGTLAGAAGVLQLAASGSGSPTFGPNLLLPMLTAVFLGATTIRPGRYSVSGTLLAVAFLAASLSGLTLIGVPDWVEPLYTGCALIAAVAISTLARRRRSGA